MVRLVPIENDVIPMVLLVNMHLIKGTLIFLCPDIFVHGILNVRRHLQLILRRTEGCHGNFVISHVKLQISVGNSMMCSDIWHEYHE